MATCRGWVLVTVLDRVIPQGKKENPFFWRARKGEFSFPFLSKEILGLPRREMVVSPAEDKFDHDKGQKSAISGRRLHWRLSTGFFVFSPVFMCNLSKTSPSKSGESSEKSSGENRVKSCRACGCHGFFGPDLFFFSTKRGWRVREVSRQSDSGHALEILVNPHLSHEPFLLPTLFDDFRQKTTTKVVNRSRVNREAQTVNWEACKEGAAETGVKRGLKRCINREIEAGWRAQTVNWGGAKPWIGHFLTGGNGTGGMRHLCGKSVRRRAPHKWHTSLPSNHFVCCIKIKAHRVIGASFACHREKTYPPFRSPPFKSARVKCKTWTRHFPSPKVQCFSSQCAVCTSWFARPWVKL